MRLTILILIFFALYILCDGYRILGIFPFNAKSHFMMYGEMMKGLARKGHQVDVISPFPLKNPPLNYRDVIVYPPVTPGLVNNLTYHDVKLYTSGTPVAFVANVAGNQLCSGMGNPEVLKFLQNPPSDPPYDVVITEIFGGHCFLAVGANWNVPVIAASSAALYPWMHGMIANPENLAFVPNNLMNYVEELDFWTRLYNLLSDVFNKLYFNYLTTPQDDIIRKYLGENSLGVREAEENVAGVLANSHFSLNGVKPITPALIEVGGLHIQEDSPELTLELKKWLDDSKDGVVYFTFGSMVKFESFPKKTIDVFYKSLGKIAPIQVLMKIANKEELPQGLPKNVHTLPWIPQLNVLKHPNVKVFITHGGLMGSQEAIHCGKPMVGIPLFADQFTNIDLYVAKGIAVKLDIDNINEKDLDAALNTVLTDPSYRKAAKYVSATFRDRPMAPVDTATYWIEYIIRNGKNSLRSPAMNLAWWQIQLLDVYGFLLLCVLVLLYLIYFFVRQAVRIIIFENEKIDILKKHR